jgi:rod shape-determining protein MreC
LKKGKFIYYVITAAIFIILEIAALTMLNNNGPLQRTWFGKAGQGFMGWFWGSTQKISDYFSLDEQNDKLAAENARLTLLLAHKRDSLVRDSLNRLVPQDGIAGDFIYIPACISKISNNSQHNYLILDKGSADGVEVGYGVITAKGVIGIIDGVSENYSYALSFKNHMMSISARLRQDGPVGTLAWDGKSRNTALLKEIPHHIQHAPGDTVYTSGYSAIFPAGIPVGTTDNARIVNGSTYEMEVNLFEDFNSLRYAIVVGNIGKDEINALEKRKQ